jgi:hypothetical protein
MQPQILNPTGAQPLAKPCFLDIEYYQDDDTLFPTAMAWSLVDGTMKTVVIAPEDDWLPEDGDTGDIDLHYLEEQGVPLIELTRELHQDLPDQTVYVDGLDPDEILIDRIFTAIGQDAPFEVAPITDLITGVDSETLEDERRAFLIEEGLEPQLPENGVYALLMLAQHYGVLGDDEFTEEAGSEGTES